MEGADGASWMGVSALVVFFVFFVGVIAWVFRPGSKQKYRDWSHIPLDDPKDEAPLPHVTGSDGAGKDKQDGR